MTRAIINMVTGEEIARNVGGDEFRRRQRARRVYQPLPEFITAPYRVCEVGEDGELHELMWSPGTGPGVDDAPGAELLP